MSAWLVGPLERVGGIIVRLWGWGRCSGRGVGGWLVAGFACDKGIVLFMLDGLRHTVLG